MEPESSFKGQEVMDSTCNIGKPIQMFKRKQNRLLCLEGGQIQAVQRGCVSFILGYMQKLTRRGPEQPVNRDPSLS